MSRKIAVQYALASRAGVPAANTFRRWAAAALPGAEADAALTIRLVDADEIIALNHQYRQQQKTTNVLSFPATEQIQQAHGLLGDVVICVPVASSEATRRHIEPAAHLAHLLIHGILHLQGYDHQQQGEAEIMESAERRILGGLGFADPY